MTEKSFIKWLRKFIDKIAIKSVYFQKRHDPTYNHTTALKEISEIIEKIKNV